MNKYAAEFLGTFALVLVGTGAIVLHDETGNVGHLGISLAFGIIVFLMIVSFGKISGAHINPAVTIALAINGKFPKNKMAGYLTMQLAGGILASSFLHYVFQRNNYLGTTLPSSGVKESFIIEFLMTYALMVVIFGLMKFKRIKTYQAAFIIGTVIFLEAYYGGPLTGASMNPARSIGPAIVSGHMEYLWLYISAPISGAVLAALFFKIFKSK